MRAAVIFATSATKRSSTANIQEGGENTLAVPKMTRSETRRTSEYSTTLSARQPKLSRNKSHDRGVAHKGSHNMIEVIRSKLHSDRGEGSGASNGPRSPLLNQALDGYSEDELNEYRQMFNIFDADRSGAIACDELEAAIHNLGLNLTREELDKIIDEVDQRGNHQIDFDEFCVVMRRLSTKKGNWTEVTQQCFQIFDRSESGVVSKKDFQYILRELGDITDPQVVDEIFAEADVDGNGLLDYEEFSFMVKNYLLEEDVLDCAPSGSKNLQIPGNPDQPSSSSQK